MQGAQGTHRGGGGLSIVLDLNLVRNNDAATGIVHHLAHVYVFPTVEAVSRIIASGTLVELSGNRRVSVPVQPTSLFGHAQGTLLKARIAEVTVHTGVRGVRVHVLEGTNHAVVVAVQTNLVSNVIGSRLQVVIATDEDIGISRAVAGVQRRHSAAVLLKDNLGQVQLALGDVAINHGLAVIDIAIEDHDDLEVLLRLLGKRIQRVVQNLRATARGDNDRSLVTVSRHAFPSG